MKDDEQAAPFRLLVTGSRHFLNVSSVDDMLRSITYQYVLTERDVVLVHGDAQGLDRTAARIAERFKWVTEPHPADWSRGSRAGPERNQRMVDLGADLCLAFPMRGSRGTWDCVRRAFDAGIPVIIGNQGCGDIANYGVPR